MIQERQRPTTEVGALRRFVVVVMIEGAYALTRASVRLLPEHHPYRAGCSVIVVIFSPSPPGVDRRTIAHDVA